MPIYLDNAATTSVLPEVLEKMMPYLTTSYGNPGSIYPLGKTAKNAVEAARMEVGFLIGCDPENVVFTSCGSESNSTVFSSLSRTLPESKRVAVIGATEHDSVLHAAEGNRFMIKFAKCGEDGRVSAEEVKSNLDHHVGIVSVMMTNNETGLDNDSAEIGLVCQDYAIPYHIDAVQAFGSHDVSVERLACDFMSMSGHKIGAPKGIGALYVRNKTNVLPSIFGGVAQEHGLRGGTENVAGIVGFGEACRLNRLNFEAQKTRMKEIKWQFYTELIRFARENGIWDKLNFNFPANVENDGRMLSVRFTGVDSQTFVTFLGSRGVCVSSGSACNAHSSEPSRVLIASGLTEDEARNTVRISFCGTETDEEIVTAASMIAGAAKNLIDMMQSGGDAV